MKIFYSEYLTEYTTYTFSYAVYCLQENPEEIGEIYARGFLPYTGNTELKGNYFYLARSLRVDLSKFEDTSENRRVNRKIEELGIQLVHVEKKLFDTHNPEFVTFCTYYAEERFLGGSMGEERLGYVTSRDTLTHIFKFCSGTKTYGYVLAFMDQNILHYWYSFFDIAFLKSHSLGKWMMWRILSWAKDNGLKHVYLGTCYKEKGLYKFRDHKGTEFFDGEKWNGDMKLLKDLCNADESGKQKKQDLFKSY